MAGVAFVVEGDGVGFATESYATSALYTTLANLSGALWRIRRVSPDNSAGALLIATDPPRHRCFRGRPTITEPWWRVKRL
jgi:hypothetical protein